jgi:exo-beta-1,3-glucanase (GH17 family)
MRIHLGIYLEGAPSTCVDAVNSNQIQTAVTLANQFPATVVAVSVGNETSFANNLPVTCLASYITTVKKNVLQAVTADDDFTFYAGLSANGEKPDLILPVLDFVSYHSYPMSDYGNWNWQQTAIAAGTTRAQAMMQASLAKAQQDFGLVRAYAYTNAGTSTTIGASLPIVIGETGWKARQTNTANPIEAVAANPVNEKWYTDLITQWVSTAAVAPSAAFVFEAFDEAWKGTDDGWGLWDANRAPRYALCGLAALPAAPVCASPLYSGAGYYQ